MIVLGFALALVMPFLLWISAVGDPRLYLDASVPAGQLTYVLSKLAGLLAVGLFTLQLFLMIFRKSVIGPYLRQWDTASHRVLGVGAFAMILLHVVLFVAGASMRSGHLTWHLLLPSFGSGYYNAMVSLGVIALYLAFCLVFLGFLSSMRSKRRGAKWRYFHRAIAFAIVPLAIVHSYSIGSETNSLWVYIFYSIFLCIMLAGLWKLSRSRAR